MLPEVRNYLYSVRSHLHLDPPTEKRVIGEFHTYFQEKIAELQESGLSEKKATGEAIRSFGRARVVARLMYEAYSKGSWTDTLLSALPHLIIAGLFFYHLWDNMIPSLVVFGCLVGATLAGWWHGKPNWLYSWVGYALMPLLVAGYLSFPVIRQTVVFILTGQGSLPPVYILLLILALFAFSVWIIVRTTIRVVRRDWILASLVLVPIPILGTWLYNLEQVGGLLQAGDPLLNQWDMQVALVLTVLAVASSFFIRLRQRVLKVGALVTLAVIATTTIGHYFWGERGLLGFLAFSVLSMLFLLSPALLEARIGHGEPEGEAEWSEEWLERPSTVE